jgi:nitroreductase
MKAIFQRRSIRKYLNRGVSERVVKELLRAGMAAPSAGDEQPWHFIVIRNRQILDCVPKIHPYSSMVKEAPLAILVCGNEQEEKYKGFWVQDCSAAVENILIAVADKKLGSVWLGIYPIEERVRAFQQLFQLPQYVIPLALLPIGYPAEKKDPNDRFTEAKVHFEKW